MTTMTETQPASPQARQDAARAGRQAAEDDFARLAGDRDALRNAWLAAYTHKFAELAAPCATEARLIAAGRVPVFHAGQRIEFASWDLLALGRGEWQAGEVDSYYEPDWQPVYPGPVLRLDVRVIGKRGQPIGKPIEVSEYQVRVPQDAEVTA